MRNVFGVEAWIHFSEKQRSGIALVVMPQSETLPDCGEIVWLETDGKLKPYRVLGARRETKLTNPPTPADTVALIVDPIPTGEK